jgi:hypothetical protein
MIERIDHEHIFVKAFEKNLKFLTETMNFTVVGTPVDESWHLRLIKIGPDVVELVDETQFLNRAKCAFLVDNIEKEIDDLKRKGIVIAESTEIGVAEWKEGKFRYVLIRMVGEEKFDGGWVELVEKGEWNP